MSKVNMKEAKTRFLALQDERKGLEFAYLSAKAEMSEKGMYGQVAQRLVDDAENTGYALKLWDDENGKEFSELKEITKGQFRIMFDEKI